MSDHWLTYVKYSYGIILDAEAQLSMNLEHNTEAYMVHLFARYLDRPSINTSPVCIRIMEGMNLPKHQRKVTMTAVAEECLLINGLELSKSRWPTSNYYIDMGRMAFDNVAYTEEPADTFYITLANNFTLLSNVLSKCKVPQSNFN